MRIEAEGIETRKSDAAQYRYLWSSLATPTSRHESASSAVWNSYPRQARCEPVGVPAEDAHGSPQPRCLHRPARVAAVRPGLRLCEACHNSVGTLQARLRSIGVLNAKHIPTEYLRASEAQRRAPLAGLLDTDGTVTNGGTIQFHVTDRRLADDVFELIVGLGYRCGRTTKRVRGRSESTSTAFILNFSTEDEVFALHRKVRIRKDALRAERLEPVRASSPTFDLSTLFRFGVSRWTIVTRCISLAAR